MPSTLVNEIPAGKSCRKTSHPGRAVPARGPGPSFWGRWWQPSRGYPLPPVSSHWGVNSANTSPQKGIPCSPPWEYCGGLAGPCKHSTHSGHSMIKPVANSAAYNFWLSYNANNSPKTRAFVKRDCASETGKAKTANPALLACVSVGVVLHAQKPVCDLICIP